MGQGLGGHVGIGRSDHQFDDLVGLHIAGQQNVDDNAIGDFGRADAVGRLRNGHAGLCVEQIDLIDEGLQFGQRADARAVVGRGADGIVQLRDQIGVDILQTQGRQIGCGE